MTIQQPCYQGSQEGQTIYLIMRDKDKDQVYTRFIYLLEGFNYVSNHVYPLFFTWNAIVIMIINLEAFWDMLATTMYSINDGMQIQSLKMVELIAVTLKDEL